MLTLIVAVIVSIVAGGAGFALGRAVELARNTQEMIRLRRLVDVGPEEG